MKPSTRTKTSEPIRREPTSQSSPVPVFQSATSRSVDPRLIPFLDLLADLLSQAFTRQDDRRPGSFISEGFVSQSIAHELMDPEEAGKASPFSTFPRDSQPDDQESATHVRD